MTWAQIAAGLNATVANHLGEAGSLRSFSGASVSCDGVLIQEPTVVGETGAYEMIPVAEIPEAQVTFTPERGHTFIDATGKRWLVDRADHYEGMWRLTLRRETSP